MKKTILVLVLMMVACVAEGLAQCTMCVTAAKMDRSDNYVSIDIDMPMDSIKVGSNHALLLTPMLMYENGTVDTLRSVGVYGRNRYYNYMRNGRVGVSRRADETVLRFKDLPDTLHYHEMVEYSSDMEGAALVLRSNVYGCCNSLRSCKDRCMLIDEFHTPIDTMWIPVMSYVRPVADSVKVRQLSGSAYIDFPVNRTEIYPEYRNNMRELMKITATIDSIRNDGDITVRRLAVKGYASPEGSYKNNTRLAKERTESLRRYVQDLYRFPGGFIQTAYEPEDWDGLRRYVAASDLAHRTEILARIDAQGDHDKKEKGIKAAYPQEYAQMLKEAYPSLRHTDYVIEYTIVTYSDVNKIRDVMRENPSKLSLNELFLLAQSYESGSAEFIEVFETAVRLYPNDSIANLNAANTALSRRDLVAAERYLAKAGQSPQAVYARGVLKMLSGDRLAAAEIIGQAVELGVPEATETLERLTKMMEILDRGKYKK